MELTSRQRKTLERFKSVAAADVVGRGSLYIIDYLVQLEEQIDAALDEARTLHADSLEKMSYVRDGVDGKDADEDAIVAKVIGRIPLPSNGKDADEQKILKSVLKKVPKAEKVDYDSILEKVLAAIPAPEPSAVIEPLRATELRDMLETLPLEERLRREALLGGDDLVDREELNRAIEILDKRTQYLINKQTAPSLVLTTTGTSGPATYINGTLNIPQYTSGSGISILVPTGTVNGSNTTFVWSAAPNVIALDNGNFMNKVSSDGTVNWTGTTTTVLNQAPNFNIYGF